MCIYYVSYLLFALYFNSTEHYWEVWNESIKLSLLISLNLNFFQGMDSVQVAVRVRPLVSQEKESGCRSCIDVYPETQQIVTKLKHDKFSFNYVFDSSTPQVDVYDSAIRSLVQQLFKGL